MRDVRLTQTANGLDILMENGRAVWAYDGTEAAQHAAIRLHKLIGESVTGNENEDYTRMYEIIFAANKSKSEKIFEIKRRILGTPGVVRIVNFTYDQEARQVNITAKVLTEWGSVDISEEVTPL